MDEVKQNKALQKAKELLEDISEDEYEQDLAFKRDLFINLTHASKSLFFPLYL